MTAAADRAYAAAHFALELDGKKDVGLFKSIEGGGVKTDLIKYQTGGEFGTYFQLGKPKYEDIKVTVGMAMSKPFFEWIAEFFKGNPIRKNGAVVAADFYYNERARRDFFEAMVSEVTFPKLDGNDKSACYMNVTISPETITYAPGSNAKLQQSTAFDRQKLWASCNFDFKLDGFEKACLNVTKVDSFTIKQKPVEYAVGAHRAGTKIPGRIEYPNLVFYVPESDSYPFVEHHMKYTIGGEIQPATRMKGEINCYDNEDASLFTLQYAGAEIFNVTHDKSDASSEEIKLVKVEMCVESIEFKYAS